MKLAFVDCETVRLSARDGSALWELAILLRDEKPLTDKHDVRPRNDAAYLWQVRPALSESSAGSLQISAYYRRCRITGKPGGAAMKLEHPDLPKGKQQGTQARLVALEVATLLDGALIIGANPWFDFGHIDTFAREHDQCLTADYHMRDIGSVVDGYLAGHDLARRNCAFCKHEAAEPLRRPESMRLTDIARALGMDPDSYDTHTALGDARLTRAIWNAVMPS